MKLAAKIFFLCILTIPVAFAQVAPADLDFSNVTDSSATLKWSNQSGGVKFYVSVSPGNHTKDNAGTSWTVTSLDPSTTYSWQVTAYKGNDIAGGKTSSGPSFTTLATPPPPPPSPPSPPSLTSPANGATGVALSTTLQWSSVSGATSYNVQVSDKSNFSSLIDEASGISGTSKSISGLSNSTKYYWRVSATNAGGTGSYSATWNFTTTQPAPPAAPALTSPADGATSVATSTTLRWNSVSGASSYNVQLGDKSNFQSSTLLVDETSITGTSKSLSGLENAKTYYWRVSANGAGGTSGWSSASFTTAQLPPPGAPSGLSAVATVAAVTLSWIGVSGATSYKWEVYYKSSLTLAKFGESTTATASVTGLPGATEFSWRVQAVNAAGSSTWSSGQSFITPIPPPQAPRNLKATNETSSGVSLSWNGASDALSYDIQILESPLFTVVKQMNVTTTSTVITGLKANTKHYAKVSSRNLGGTSDPIQVEFMTLPAPPAVPASLTATVTETGATLSWGSVAAILNYVVEVHDKQSYNSLIRSATVTTNSASITGLESDKLYYWRVKSVGVGGESDWARGEFRTKQGAVKPNPPTVAVAKTSSTATFTFNSVTGATLYEVKLYDKANNGVLQGSGSTTNASTPVTITSLKSDERYYYEATVTVGSVTSDPTKGDFTTERASASVPPPEVTVAKTSSTASFTFKAVTGATLYEVKLYDKANNGTLQGSGSTTNASTPVAITGLKSKERYYYEATVAVGTLVSDPTKGDFTTDEASASVPPPEVSVAKTSNTATFTFKAVTGATLYEVKLFDKQNTTNATPIDRGSTTDPTKPVTFSNLKSREKYFYEATVTIGTQTSEPTKGDFTTDQASSSVPPPIVNVVGTTTTAVFTFQAVTGATLYEVKLYDKQNTTNATPITQGSTTDPAKPVTLTNLISNERYYYEATVTIGVLVSAPTKGSFETDKAPATDVVAAPSGLQVADITGVSATLSWNGASQGVKFEIELSPGGVRNANVSSPYALTSLLPGTQYTWSVRAVKGNAVSEWIAGPTFTTLSTPPPPPADAPSAPAGLGVSSVTGSSAVLSWTGDGQGVKFELQVSPGGIADGNASAPYSLLSLMPSTRYTWYVRATKGNSSSNWVQGPSFTTGAGVRPPAPSLTIAEGSNSATFRFAAVSGATRYEINILDRQNNGTVVATGSTANPQDAVVISGLQPKTKYFYEARVTVGGLTSDPATGSFTTDRCNISRRENRRRRAGKLRTWSKLSKSLQPNHQYRILDPEIFPCSSVDL